MIIFHYNEKGANGKSTKFALIKRSMGEQFMKCSSSLLGSMACNANPSGPNEELMSTRGKRLVLFSEPNAKVKLSSAFIKELTGGDEQSTRGNYGKKQNFVMNGTVHVLCNKIPETDDMDGGMSRRLRCVPYGSTFVPPGHAVDEAQHVYEKRDVADRFGEWKFYLMYEMMAAAEERVAARERGKEEDVPDVVMAATRRLIEREDALAGFVSTRLKLTGAARDSVTLKDAVDSYRAYCVHRKKPADARRAQVDQRLLERMGPYSAKHGNNVKWWRGWTLVSEGEEADEGDEDAPGVV